MQALDRNDVESLRGIFPEGYAYCLGVKPVDADEDGSDLEAALAQHRQNIYYVDRLDDWLFRDDVMGLEAPEGATQRKALYEYQEQFENSQVPMMYWAGWLDSATTEGGVVQIPYIRCSDSAVHRALEPRGLIQCQPLLPAGHAGDAGSAGTG